MDQDHSFFLLSVLVVASLLLGALLGGAFKSTVEEASNRMSITEFHGHTYIVYGSGVVHDPDCKGD